MAKFQHVLLSPGAKDRLVATGNHVTQAPGGLHTVSLAFPPGELEVVYASEQGRGGYADDPRLGLRLRDEPPFGGELPAEAVSWWIRGDWTACPDCGAALEWDEAGHVPGHRRCLNGHAVMLSGDGRSAGLAG